MTASFGTDPEFFVANRNTNAIVPVCGLLGGTKDKPALFDVKLNKKKHRHLSNPGLQASSDYFYHEDNVVAELGMPPTSDPYMAVDIIQRSKQLLAAKLRDAGLRYYSIPANEFSPEQLQTPQAQEFGCDVDFCAYDGGKQARNNIPDFGNWRFAGGHVHMGGQFNCPSFVAVLLLELTLALFINRNANPRQKELNRERLRWYGAAGNYRDKPYGIEYRTPSNIWLSNDNNIFAVASTTLSLANWLENTPAIDIKKVTDGVSWYIVRDFVNGDDTLASQMAKQQALARSLGLVL